MRTWSVAVTLIVLASAPLWAWPTSGDNDVLAQRLDGFAKAAMAEAQKALDAQPAEINKARFLLLAIADLCVPAGGNSPKVPDETIAAYKALYPKAWANGIPAEADFDKSVAAYEEKFDRVYINAFYIVDNQETYTIARLLEQFSKGASQYPNALALCVEFAGLSIPPEDYTKYFYAGKNSRLAFEYQQTMANVFAGPETIRVACQETFVGEAIKQAEQSLGYIDPNENDPLILKARAGQLEVDFLNFIAWADPENAQLKELQAKVKALRDKAKAIYAAQVKANRVPGDRYSGEDAAALKQAMKAEFNSDPGDTIVRITITSSAWREQAHVWSGINALDVGWYKLIDAAVVVKKADGTFWVHPVTYGKRWTGTGDRYGDLKVFSWADDYEILAAWVNK